jgi:hypothetical protein
MLTGMPSLFCENDYPQSSATDAERLRVGELCSGISVSIHLIADNHFSEWLADSVNNSYGRKDGVFFLLCGYPYLAPLGPPHARVFLKIPDGFTVFSIVSNYRMACPFEICL